MKARLLVVLTLLMVFAVVSAAFAQYDEDKPSKVNVKITNYVPLGSELRDFKTAWMGPAFDYNLKYDEKLRPTEYASFGLFSSGDAYQKAAMYPITYTKITRKDISESKASYTGYGAGVYRLYRRAIEYTPSAHLDKSTTFLPGIHAVYGREINTYYFAEIKLDLLPKWKGTDWSGVSLNIGTRVSL